MISTIRRTGRLLAASMPVSNSARPALPPQPSWRIRSRMVAEPHVARRSRCVSLNIRSLPQRSQVMRMNHDGNAERLVEGFAAGRQRLVAVAAPVPFGDRSRGHGFFVVRRSCASSRGTRAGPRAVTWTAVD